MQENDCEDSCVPFVLTKILCWWLIFNNNASKSIIFIFLNFETKMIANNPSKTIICILPLRSDNLSVIVTLIHTKLSIFVSQISFET